MALTQAYRLTPNSLDQVEASAAWPILRNWNAYGRVVYALDQHQMLERFAGIRVPRLLLGDAGSWRAAH